jgi:transposase-like protein
VPQHTNAATTPCQRGALRSLFLSDPDFSTTREAESLRTSRQTVHKWARRDTPTDRPSGRPVGSGRMPWGGDLQSAVLFFRGIGLSVHEIAQALIFDDASVQPSAATLHRRLAEQGASRLTVKEQRRVEKFQQGPVGYLHIDLFYLPDVYGRKRYCYVAIERVSRMLYVWIATDRTERTGARFLAHALAFFPCHVHTVLTDNGGEFGGKGRARGRPGLFDRFCRMKRIKHRRIRPLTPQTNGMVERANASVKRGTGLDQIETWSGLCPRPTDREIWAAQAGGPPLLKDQAVPEPVAQYLALWNVFWNEIKPHRTLAWRCPLDLMMEQYQAHPSSFHRPPVATVRDRTRLNDMLGGQRFSFTCVAAPLRARLLSTS